MNVSALLVGVRPEHQAHTIERLDALGWAEVHHAEDNGRLIVVIEGEGTEEEIARVQAVKRLPGVLFAEMVVHCFDEEAPAAPDDGRRTLTYLNTDDPHATPPSYYRTLKALGNH